MQKFDVQLHLEHIAEARKTWAKNQTEFARAMDAMMKRLIHEAARNYMSAEDVARFSGMTVKRVRTLMREAGLNPRDGKRLLSEAASKALTGNAELLSIDPAQIDLMSPLAYLPMGEQMQRQLRDSQISQVTELPEFPETHGPAHQMAEKLTDAGLNFDDAVEWVNEVIARGETIK